MSIWRKMRRAGRNAIESGKDGLDKVRTVTKRFVGRMKGVSEDDPKVKMDDALTAAINEYNEAYATLNDIGTNLYNERTRAVGLIELIENLINSIAESPKEFETSISEIRVKKESFKEVCDFAKEEIETSAKSAVTGGVGVTAGAAVVSIAPTAAMWVATTFGTASTGAAISTLSGAAATNAALAWLGGGALAAGGGGMAAGNAFLALAGPVGWTIAGASILTSIVLFSKKKSDQYEKKNEEIKKVKKNTASLKKLSLEIQLLLDEVTALRNELNDYTLGCVSFYNKNFNSLSYEDQMKLGTIVNNTKALASSLGKTVSQ